MSPRKPAITFIFISLLIDIMGFGLLAPVLPGLISHLTGKNISQSGPIFGLLTALFGLMQFFFAPIIGRMSDAYGRRPVLLVSLLFTAGEYVLMATTHQIFWLFVGRITSGITAASFTAASAYIADVSPPEKRAENFGLIGAAFGIGFIIGPMMGGVLGGFGERVPFWGAAVITLLNFCYGWFILPESLELENRTPFKLKLLNPFGNFSILTRYTWVLALTGATTLIYFASQALQTTWVLFTTYRYHWDVKQNGYSLAFLGLCALIVQMWLIRILLPKLGERRAILYSFAIDTAAFLAMAICTKGWMLYPIMAIWSLSFIGGPAIQGLVSTQYDGTEQGAVQGSLTGIQSLTGVVGPIFFGFLFTYTTSTPQVQIPGAIFYVSSFLVLLALILAIRAFKISDTSVPIPAT